MANSKAVINTSQTSSGGIWSPGFIDELRPCSQQVSLLYHISYLCLAKSPKLEKLLRMRATDTQLLFVYSEAALLKCVGTSDNLVSSLFPILVTAIEKNKPTVAGKFLVKAKAWITELIHDVEQIEKKYEELNTDVAATTSDIITEKKEIEKIKESKEIEELMKKIKTIEDQQTEISKQLKEKEKKTDEKNRQLQDLIKSTTSANKGLSILFAISPFVGSIIEAIYETVIDASLAGKLKALEAELKQFNSDKIFLKQREWDLQVQLMDCQMKLSKEKAEQGLILDSAHLSEVQRYLSKIQDILLKLTQFWKYVDTLLGTIKEKTFVGEDLVDEPDLKDIFLKSIQDASKIWAVFGGRCNQCVQMFKVQSKDAYRFLEINPDTLSPEVQKEEYNGVMEQLKQIKVSGEDETPAIQQ